MKKNWWQLTSKEKKEIFDRSAQIFYAFDGIQDPGSKIGKSNNAIKEMVYQVAEKEYNNLFAKIEAEEALNIPV